MHTRGVPRPAPSPPCSGHAGRRGLLGLKAHGWMVPGLCLALRGWVWVSSTSHGNLMLQGRQAAKTSGKLRALGLFNQKLNHCKLPLSGCSPQVTKWRAASYKAAFPPCASPETGGPRSQVYWDSGYTQLWCYVGLPMISRGHVGSRRSPTSPRQTAPRPHGR